MRKVRKTEKAEKFFLRRWAPEESGIWVPFTNGIGIPAEKFACKPWTAVTVIGGDGGLKLAPRTSGEFCYVGRAAADDFADRTDKCGH